ncbi:MAG: DNA topoisomerase III [Tannerella sp.]|jgi:DNA topoisomerase-3|nr:DNA topoisomerase III [Tannerella sp.]
MIAIITDRANIAKQIASSLDMDITTENEGYFQGRGFTLVWTDGELISLSSPEGYEENRLAKDDLPFIPQAFSFAVCKKKTARGTVVTDKAAVKQLNRIKKVFDECESIVAATDFGEAGELLFRRIYTYLECKKPFKRLWINSLTLKSIREGFQNLAEGSLYDNLYNAADCREKADYLINFNASRVFGVATGLVCHPLGREQTPTLAILCKRYHERRNFVSIRFFEHRISLGKDGLFLSFALPCTMKNRRNAEKIYEHLKTLPAVQITKVETRSRIQPAPLFYNLTALQKDANERYGFSATQTMEIARKLYEEKLISHPLTESRYIPEDIFKTVPKIIRQTAVYCKMKNSLKTIDMENLNRRSVKKENIRAAGHHALIPTGTYPGYLPKNEKTVYEMIVSRMFEAFAPDCQKEIIRIEAVAGNLVFKSEQSRIITPGWRTVQNREEDCEEDEAKESDIFPVFTEGETVPISGWNLLTKKTLPPPLYTEASLLQAMEKAGLGTPATRTCIIESLFSCGYVERQGQNLVSTEKGLVVHNHIKEHENCRRRTLRQLGKDACRRQ